MSYATLAVPGVMSPLQSLWRWFAPAKRQGRPASSELEQRDDDIAIASLSITTHRARIEVKNLCRAPTHRPLRIVRIMEVGQAPANVGRMVISGRMADVCAELDRLAALH
jgi:hypothetical protein